MYLGAGKRLPMTYSCRRFTLRSSATEPFDIDDDDELLLELGEDWAEEPVDNVTDDDAGVVINVSVL